MTHVLTLPQAYLVAQLERNIGSNGDYGMHVSLEQENAMLATAPKPVVDALSMAYWQDLAARNWADLDYLTAHLKSRRVI